MQVSAVTDRPARTVAASCCRHFITLSVHLSCQHSIDVKLRNFLEFWTTLTRKVP